MKHDKKRLYFYAPLTRRLVPCTVYLLSPWA